MTPAAEQFRNAIRATGIEPPDVIEADGKLRRFSANGKRGDDAGWYVLHDDGIPAGSFGDWRSGITQTWRAEIGRTLTPAEETAHRTKVEAMRREREAEEARSHAEAATKAEAIWKSAQAATDDHPYLVAKSVKSFGLRVHEGRLLVPMRDGTEIHSLQTIAPDGEKLFLPGGRVKGCYFSIGKPDGVLCIAEGYATGASVHQATGYTVAVAFTAVNLEAVAKALRVKFPQARIVIAGDNDASNTGQRKAEEAARAIGGLIAIPAEAGKDWNDIHRERGAEAVRTAIEAARLDTGAASGGTLRAVTLADFLALDIPVPEPLLAPLFTRQSLSLVYSWRGIGKTWFALCAAYAIASGGTFLRWKAPQPRRVLYLDGEMPAAALQRRLASIAAGSETEASGDYFKLVTPDLCGGLVPDLATIEGQKNLNALIAESGSEFIVVDNLSCWVRSGVENEAESWRVMAEWLLQHRSNGRAILLVHHAGKGGAQRGTSKKEDILDVSLDLRRPPTYEAEQGAAFAVEFKKSRHLTGTDAESFEAALTIDENGAARWTMKALKESTHDRVVELAALGLTQKDIAEELDIHKSSVSRHWNKAVEAGLIKPKARAE